MDQARVRLMLLLLAALGLYLVGNASVPLMDRDEPRYAQCSRQMLQSGDWVVPRLYDEIRAKKPPLIYWCQASVMGWIGDTAFAARLPSVLAVFATACLLAIFVWKSGGPQLALWTTLVFCSTALVIVAAKSSMTDGVLLLWTVIAQICVYAIWRGNRSWSMAMILAIAIALGLLTKVVIGGVEAATVAALGIMQWWWGPAGAEIPGSAKFKITGAQIAQAFLGVLVVACIVGPWVYLVRHRSPEFLRTMRDEAAGHVFKDMEGHAGWPGMHLLMIWGDFFPWSLLLPAAIVVGWRHRHDPLTRFALAATIGPWLMVEFTIRTKLPQYMLPTIPALSFLTARAIVGGINDQEDSFREERRKAEGGRRIVRGVPDKEHGFSSRQFVGAARIWAFIVIVIGLLPWLAALRFRPLPWATMIVISLAAIAWGASVVFLLHRGRSAHGIAGLGIGMFCLTGLLYGVYFPRAQFLRLSILAADVLRKEGAIHPNDAIMTDYKEPSLAFYQGGTIRERLSPVIVKAKLDEWAPWIVMTRDVWDRSPPEVQARLQEVAHFHGLSVADGMRDVEVMVVRRKW
jgi:4-amino-4-deoxy-L-arabinose transferase-like glycosyltransferase